MYGKRLLTKADREEARKSDIDFFVSNGYKLEEYDGFIALTKDEDRHYSLVTYFGNSAKTTDRCYFVRKDERDARINRYIEGVKARKEFKAKQKAKRSAPHELKVGDILVNSWGYDQTNVDFFEVVELVGKASVKIRPIGAKTVEATGPFSSDVKPVPGSYHGEAVVKRVNGNSVKIHSWGSYAFKTEPERTHHSSWGH